MICGLHVPQARTPNINKPDHMEAALGSMWSGAFGRAESGWAGSRGGALDGAPVEARRAALSGWLSPWRQMSWQISASQGKQVLKLDSPALSSGP